MIDKLLKIFSNRTRSLEILYLLNGIKKAVRLDANEAEIERIKQFCDGEKLSLEMSDFKIIKTADKGKGGYANSAIRVPISYRGYGLYHLYISKDKSKAKFLKLLENKNDDGAIGEILGYPECCVEFFVSNKGEQEKLQNDYILPALKNSQGYKFPFYTNYAIRYFDVALLSHFPHDFNCSQSIKIARENLNVLSRHSQELANQFEDMLKSPVLYTESNGIFVFKNFRLTGNFLEYNGVMATIKNKLFNELIQNKKIEIITRNKIKIGDNILEDAGFMIFT